MIASRDSNRWAVILGIVSGAGALVRPTVLACPVIWVAYTVLQPRTMWRRMALVSVIAGISMTAVIIPWTLRNRAVLGAWIPISTNGGDVFYSANSPTATGGYESSSALRLAAYPGGEVQWNRIGYDLGRQWITEHPWGFVKLSLAKMRILLQADNTGAYWSLKRAYGDGGPAYTAAVVLSNVWWLLVWVVTLFAVLQEQSWMSRNSTVGLILCGILFFVFCHAVFQSQPRHHTPFTGILIALTCGALAQAGRSQRGKPLRGPEKAEVLVKP